MKKPMKLKIFYYLLLKIVMQLFYRVTSKTNILGSITESNMWVQMYVKSRIDILKIYYTFFFLRINNETPFVC